MSADADRDPAPGGSVLVVGFGNPGRLDDGLGPALAERVRAMDLPGVRAQSTYQLAVEDATAVAEHDIAIFADASLSAEPPFSLRPVVPRAQGAQFTTHFQAPEGILGLAHEVLGATTRGYALGIRGYEFDAFGERLSARARANLDAAAAYLNDVLPGRGAMELEPSLSERGSTS